MIETIRKAAISLLVLLLFFSQLACKSVQPIVIETLQPAEKPIDALYYNIAFANGALPSTPSQTQHVIFDHQMFKDTICTDTLVSFAFLEGVASVSSETALYNAYPDIELISQKEQTIGVFKESAVYGKLLDNDTDILFILKEVTAQPYINIYSNPGNYEAETAILTTATLLQYDMLNNRIIKKEKISDTAYYYFIDYNYYTTFEAASDYTPVLEESAYLAGRALGTAIFPHWQTEKRLLFTDSNASMKLAQTYVDSGSWSDAIRIWTTFTEDSESKLYFKAAYNLAVAAEMEGRPDLSKTWLEKSAQQSNHKEIKLYQKVINERLVELREIEKQMNINIIPE